MANGHVYGANAIEADVLTNCWTQVQNSNRVTHSNLQVPCFISIFLPTSTKPPGAKIQQKQRPRRGITQRRMQPERWSHSPLWRAIDKRWNRNTVSLVSSVTAVMRLPISWINSVADWFQVPAVSTATGKKTWEAESAPYFTILFAAALFAAEHASLAVWSTVCATQHRCQELWRPMPRACLVPKVAMWCHRDVFYLAVWDLLLLFFYWNFIILCTTIVAYNCAFIDFNKVQSVTYNFVSIYTTWLVQKLSFKLSIN